MENIKERIKGLLDGHPLFYRFVIYYRTHHRLPNLIKPSLFNDKMTWRILFDRRDFLVWACDKLEMKIQAESRCPEVLIPETLAVFRTLDELKAIELNGDWVLKEISGSGQVYFGSGTPNSTELSEIKSTFDKWEVISKQRRKREWGYSQAKRGYFIERRITREDLPDYKFHTFDGQVKFVSVHYGRRVDHRHAVFTPEGVRLPIKVGREIPDNESPLPDNFQTMRNYAEKMGQGIDYVRIDFYSYEGKIYFGEFTPYFASGLWKISPPEYERIWGTYWNLPKFREVRNKYRKRPSSA